MSKLFGYVMKTLLRHRTRTLLTVTGSAAALFVFCMVAAVQKGMNELASRHDRSLVVFQANKFCPATSHLPQDYTRAIEKIPGVQAAMPVQVFTNNCRVSLDIVVFYGVLPQQLQEFRDFTLLEGSWEEFEQHQDAAMIGSAVAQRRGIEVGGKFTIGDESTMTVTAAGIFESTDVAEEQYIYTHLEFLQRRGGQNSVGTVTQVEVQLNEGASVDATAEAIDDHFRSGQVETDTRAKGVFQAASLGDLFEVAGLLGYLGWACLGVMTALVATTSLMSVQDRRDEHAVLKTLGFTNGTVFGLVLGETSLQGLLGGMAGTLLSYGFLWYWPMAIAAEAVSVSFSPDPQVLGLGLAISAVIGLLAGIPSAIDAARHPIVDGLHAAG